MNSISGSICFAKCRLFGRRITQLGLSNSNPNTPPNKASLDRHHPIWLKKRNKKMTGRKATHVSSLLTVGRQGRVAKDTVARYFLPEKGGHLG
ncbi:hypothetical protein CDAR_492691 [Caerostris darwini]|uniref:Uncharacterized protein n=1 Tax=Caerostris darwini TaxID=1538125 RepID=A0AAV4UZ10_9ARAC|nr:hypothetical protein CDAR_492691 [Caerostris darwini]